MFAPFGVTIQMASFNTSNFNCFISPAHNLILFLISYCQSLLYSTYQQKKEFHSIEVEHFFKEVIAFHKYQAK
uniref:Uncharacterized protein n=1 Tax=Meloidogyne incognita TaxID=6306 RepID=A0A914LLZ9_MELIC